MVGSQKGGAHKKDPDYGKIRVFAYGTLKRGQPNNIVLRKSGGECLGFDSVSMPSGAFMDLGGFPAIIHPISNSSAASQLVRGEVWYGSQEMLKSCDILEGHPLFYRRTKVWSHLLTRRVWVYSLSEEFIAEGEDFMSEPWWKPSDHEKRFWETMEDMTK